MDAFNQIFQLLSPLDAACILGAMLLIRLSRHAGMWVYALVGLPGTFAHELAHFIVAFVLRARPSWPSLIPRRTERGWLLGSVAFQAGYLRRLPIAMAPFALAPLALWLAKTLLHSSAWPAYAMYAWIVAALLNASFPSPADFKLAWPALPVLASIGFGVWMVYR